MMGDEKTMQRVAAWTAIVSCPLYFAMLALAFVGISSDIDGFSDPGTLSLELLSGKGSVVRWCMLLDMVGCYLLVIPLTLFLWHWLRPKSPLLVGLFTVCGLGYCLFGAMGAAILAAVCPGLLEVYSQATGVAREAYETMFWTFTGAVYAGVWGYLDTMIAGVWWIGIGYYLREERRILGWLTIVLGISYISSGTGRIIGAEAILLLGIFIYFLLAPLWALFLGIDLLRKPARKPAD